MLNLSNAPLSLIILLNSKAFLFSLKKKAYKKKKLMPQKEGEEKSKLLISD